METLDQLLGGNLPLATIRGLYPTIEAFRKGILGLLSGGDVRLRSPDGKDVEQWRWRVLFSAQTSVAELDSYRLDLTDQGAHKIA
jgi:hypothetical protein